VIGMTSSGHRFLGLARYVLHGRSGEETERVAWTTGRNLGTDDPELAAALMQATADQNVRVEAPVYHVTISFDPTDAVTRERMEAVADRVLADLGLAEHQTLLVAHQDRAHQHVHLMINRVHPETGLAWERWQDRPRIEQSLRELEQELGLRAVAGRLYQLEGQELPERARLTTGEYQQALRTGELAFPDRVRAHLAELRATQSWAELEERLGAHGLRLERKGQGLVITDGEHQVKASRVARDLSLHRLEERFGVPFPGREEELARRAPLNPDLAQLKPALEEYERVVALPREVYRAEQDISSLNARQMSLDHIPGRLQATSERFDHALTEVYRDVSLDREVVTFRPNTWRRLKTVTSHRSVPLWPQLRAALGRYLAERPPSRLLFPSYRTGQEALLTDFRKLLDALAVRAGWKTGEIRSKMFRHTYCAARLQTLDQGAPVSTYTVAREMGHGGEAMVRRVYGHLGQLRHRAEAVEYRVEQHAAKLGARLEALRGSGFGTTIGTTA